MSFDVEHGGSLSLRLGEHVTTSLGETSVNTSNSSLGTLDFAQVHRLKQTGVGPKDGSITDTSSCGDDLSTSSVDGVCVQGYIVDVDSYSSHVLFTQNSLVGGPLESSDD